MRFLVIFSIFASFLFSANLRLVVLDNAIIEDIYLLGKEEVIVGIATSKSLVYPKEKTSKLESVGTYVSPSLEKILLLKPDYVVLNRYTINIKQKLEQSGIKTLSFEFNSLQDIQDNLLKIGALLKQEQKAKAIADEFKQKMTSFAPLSLQGIFVYQSQPLMIFASNTLIGDILSSFGVKNIRLDIKDLSRPIISSEAILSNEIDFILYGLSIKDKAGLLKQNPSLKSTKAYKNHAIEFVQPYALLRGSPLIIKDIQKLYDILATFKKL